MAARQLCTWLRHHAGNSDQEVEQRMKSLAVFTKLNSSKFVELCAPSHVPWHKSTHSGNSGPGHGKISKLVRATSKVQLDDVPCGRVCALLWAHDAAYYAHVRLDHEGPFRAGKSQARSKQQELRASKWVGRNGKSSSTTLFPGSQKWPKGVVQPLR